MSKLKGTISITRPQGIDWNDEFSIVIRDNKSRAQFLEIKIGAKELMLALSNLSDQPMEFTTRALQNVGKNVIYKTIEVELPEGVSYSGRSLVALERAKKQVADTNWIVSDYFGSKDSYFTKDGVEYARARCTAYLNDEEYEIYLKEQNGKV